MMPYSVLKLRQVEVMLIFNIRWQPVYNQFILCFSILVLYLLVPLIMGGFSLCDNCIVLFIDHINDMKGTITKYCFKKNDKRENKHITKRRLIHTMVHEVVLILRTKC